MEDRSAWVLTADAADRYIDRVSALLRAAHLNSYFCPAERILRNLAALHSRTHGGLHPQLHIEPTAGLPAQAEWARVHDDLVQAATISEAAALAEDPRKPEYFSRLRVLSPDPLEALKVELRHHDREHKILHVRVVVDIVQVNGLLVRWTVEMAETAQSIEAQLLLVRNGNDLFVSPELGSRLSMLASSTAESAFLELSAQPGVTVQRVCKATVGPFCLAEVPGVLPFGPLLTDPRGAFASFSLDTAARDIVRDGNNDPLTHRLVEPPDGGLLSDGEHSRLRVGYRVYRDRKFVTDHATQPALEELCRSAGTRNVIYLAAINNSTPADLTGVKAATPAEMGPNLGAGAAA